MKGDKRAGGQAPASPAASGSSPPDGARAGGAAAAPSPAPSSLPNRILGSLRDALNAAGRDDRSGEISLAPRGRSQQAESARSAAAPATAASKTGDAAGPAQRDGHTATREERHVELGDPTRGRADARAAPPRPPEPVPPAPVKTQALRGKAKVAHNAFHQDPVVGWLVVVGGAGLGAFRPIYEGNNSVGRGRTQRIAIDFGDDTISTEEQAYIRYDSMDRSFLFVPNLSKTNIVAVNDKKPTGAVKLELMDVITMGRTQLAFVPFCGEDFDWSELSDLKE
jgi:hypothetical protein